MKKDQSIIFQGIYDLRTLEFLKKQKIHRFVFDFNPRSFNFIQEYIFWDIVKKAVSGQDQVLLYFEKSDDPMIQRLLEEIKNHDLRATFYFNNITPAFSQEISTEFYLNYHHDLEAEILLNPYCKGLVIDFKILEETYLKGTFANFTRNFYFRYPSVLRDDFNLILKLDWNDHLIRSIEEYFEFSFYLLTITSDVEVCYRNVDLKKLEREMLFIVK